MQLAQGGLNEFANSTNLGETDLIPAVANVINILLGILGVIVVVGILYGGFRMMTSGGNEEQKSSGQKIVVAGV